MTFSSFFHVKIGTLSHENLMRMSRDSHEHFWAFVHENSEYIMEIDACTEFSSDSHEAEIFSRDSHESAVVSWDSQEILTRFSGDSHEILMRFSRDSHESHEIPPGQGNRSRPKNGTQRVWAKRSWFITCYILTKQRKCTKRNKHIERKSTCKRKQQERMAKRIWLIHMALEKRKQTPWEEECRWKQQQQQKNMAKKRN